MDDLIRHVMREMNQLDAREWLYVLVGVVFVGLFCLRGFGSRSDY
jgi:hypothetical protein